MAEQFQQVVRDYMAATNTYQPVGASARGFHEHDADLGNRGEAAIRTRASDLRRFLDRLATIDSAALAKHEPYDADLLRRRIGWELTDIERVRSWQRSPGGALGTIGGGCNGLVIRDFAPLDDRLRSLISRLRAAPALLEQARANMTDPTRYHVETAIEAGTGMRALFERDLPEAASKSGDAKLKQDFEAANKGALAAVDAYVQWMKDELLPRAGEDFAWGHDLIAALLSQSDSIDEPIERLIARGDEDLREHQDLLRELTVRIDPSGSPAEVVDAVARDHPSPDELIPFVRGLLEELRTFSVDAKLCTMPTDVRIAVTETPGFSRMTTQAACSSPGPFETKATDAYYYVTPADQSWPAERIESYMRFFNRWSIPGVTAHEAYPGHYVHLTYLNHAKSEIGRYLLTTTAVEGWAHYIEQVMSEAGYGGGNPRYELMQIREALLRLCRYRCAFGMHVEGWSPQRSIEFFMKEGFTSQVIAERETRRGVLGPNYYAYTMGKHQILRLRERVRERHGAKFDLRTFHDEFMQLPYPVATIERIMLGAAA